MKGVIVLLSVTLSHGVVRAAEPPKAGISNGLVQAEIYLPDAKSGYYRGTRFDWSGVIYSLKYQGHNYYGPWFQRTDPKEHDFAYVGGDIVAGPCSAITGPVDEFGQLGWDDAKPGGTFIKIGVGALRKPGESVYDKFTLYEVADPGKWTIRRNSDSIEFTHELAGGSSGYGYRYRKTLRLTKDKPELVLDHRLENTGRRAIQTDVYNHNFLVLDGAPPGPEVTISVPFQIRTPRPPDPTLASIKGNQIVYLRTLADRDRVTTLLEGFGPEPKNHEIRIENAKLRAGMNITGDRPLLREALWSIRTVLSIEPFVSVSVEPGREFTWKSTYSYYTTGPAR